VNLSENVANSQIRGNTVISTVATNPSTLTQDELYFGTSLPDGKSIAEDQWQQFLNDEITPHFREGLTVVDGYGQYLDSSGTLLREKTKLVILIYEPSPSREKAIQEIMQKYKQKFQQESVLRVTNEVRATFF
jgi:hypothetical protein